MVNATATQVETYLLKAWEKAGFKEIYKYKGRIKAFREPLTNLDLLYEPSQELFTDVQDIADFAESSPEQYKIPINFLLAKRSTGSHIFLSLKNERGLHATPAAMFAQTAMKFKSKILVSHYDSPQVVDAKSLVHVVALGGKKGDLLRVFAKGEDEDEALAELEDLVHNRNFDGE